MKNRWMWSVVALLAGAGVFVGLARAQDEGAGRPAWMVLGPQHEAMKKFLGRWEVSSVWHFPGGDIKSQGNAR